MKKEIIITLNPILPRKYSAKEREAIREHEKEVFRKANILCGKQSKKS